MSRSKPDVGNGASTPRRGAAVFSLSLAICGVVAALVVFADYQRSVDQIVLREGEEVEFVIPRGAPWIQTVDILKRVNLIQRNRYFEFWARGVKLPPRVKAGDYRLVGPMTWSGVADALIAGGSEHVVEVTIPEGWSMFHIAELLEHKGVADGSEFLRLAEDPETLESMGLGGQASAEGYLFPDTYEFRQGASAQEIMSRQVARFRQVWSEVQDENPGALSAMQDQHGLSAGDVVNLASLVEKEAARADEQRRIARVFVNRLRLRMKLQTDPTCVYGPYTFREVPRPRRCKDPKNRYSTYVIHGLPPTPIANPGRGALAAALHPDLSAESNDLLYFVAKRDGSRGHHFSTSYKEHRAAVRKYLKSKK